jgi:hypothetical protein
MQPWLTEEEITDLCAGLKQPAAQARFLRQLGLTVKKKPNGRPLVMRSHCEQVLNPQKKQKPQEKISPNRMALIHSFEKA